MGRQGRKGGGGEGVIVGGNEREMGGEREREGEKLLEFEAGCRKNSCARFSLDHACTALRSRMLAIPFSVHVER